VFSHEDVIAGVDDFEVRGDVQALFFEFFFNVAGFAYQGDGCVFIIFQIIDHAPDNDPGGLLSAHGIDCDLCGAC